MCRYFAPMLFSTLFCSCLLASFTLASAFAASSSASAAPSRAILVTGANKGQGKALCERILTECTDTTVFLCSRDVQRGEQAAAELRQLFQNDDGGRGSERVHVVQLDVTSSSSVSSAVQCVRDILGPDGKLYGLVSNAGILWGYPLPDLIDVCATGVRKVLDAFLPLMDEVGGRAIVVTSGLGPLMHGYADEEKRKALQDPSCTWEGTIQPMIDECLQTYEQVDGEERPKAFERIGFPGGPFADSAPDFHMYGIAKAFADAYMLSLSRSFPSLQINSVDPGLVYTDLILKMEKYKGKDIEDTGAQTPKQGVEATMRLLFDDITENGRFYTMNKDKTHLVHSSIDKMPEK